LSIPNRFNLIIGLVDPAPSSSRLTQRLFLAMKVPNGWQVTLWSDLTQ